MKGADAYVYLVKGDDPILRDREAARLIDALLAGEDRSLALEDFTVPPKRGGGGDEPDGGESSGTESLRLPMFASVMTAVTSPPFMTAVRVVVVREIGQLSAEQGRWLAEYVTEPLETTRLVLVAGGGRVPAALEKAAKGPAVTVVGPTSEDTATVLEASLRSAGLRLSPAASARVAAHFGEDAGRVPEFVELLGSAFDEGVTLEAAEVEPYLGESGTVDRFALTNAIDRGDPPAALETLHRMLHATSAKSPKPLHPLQIMASLTWHYQRLLRLDDPAVATKEQAAQVLGMKSAAGARFPLEAARRLGSDGLREALGYLAEADLDLRGATAAEPDTVAEVLVARLAALSRRKGAGTARRR